MISWSICESLHSPFPSIIHFLTCPIKICCVLGYVMRQRHAILPQLLTIPISLRPLNIFACVYSLYTCSCQIDSNNKYILNRNGLGAKACTNWSHNNKMPTHFWDIVFKLTKPSRIKSNRNESTHKNLVFFFKSKCTTHFSQWLELNRAMNNAINKRQNRPRLMNVWSKKKSPAK